MRFSFSGHARQCLGFKIRDNAIKTRAFNSQNHDQDDTTANHAIQQKSTHNMDFFCTEFNGMNA